MLSRWFYFSGDFNQNCLNPDIINFKKFPFTGIPPKGIYLAVNLFIHEIAELLTFNHTPCSTFKDCLQCHTGEIYFFLQKLCTLSRFHLLHVSGQYNFAAQTKETQCVMVYGRLFELVINFSSTCNYGFLPWIVKVLMKS